MYNSTNTTQTELFQNREAVGLVLFVVLCLFLLCGLVVVLFNPCKNTKCVGLGMCVLFFRYMCMKLYSCLCCRCCKRGHKYLVKKASLLQQDMEKELEEWNELEESDDISE